MTAIRTRGVRCHGIPHVERVLVHVIRRVVFTSSPRIGGRLGMIIDAAREQAQRTLKRSGMLQTVSAIFLISLLPNHF